MPALDNQNSTSPSRQKKEIEEEAKSLASLITENSSKDINEKSSDDKKQDEFLSRYWVKNNLFAQFTEEFSKTTREKGVELHWIGVGTWKTPVEVVSEKRLEAWKLSHENNAKGNQKALDALLKTKQLFRKP